MGIHANAQRARRQRAKDRKGSHTVEFALVFPIVLTFFFGLIFLSRALMLQDVSQHAAFEGARAGILLNSTESDCQEAVNDFVGRLGIREVKTFVNPTAISNEEEVITVQVSIPLAPNAWVSSGFVPRGFDITSEITLTRRSE